MASGVRNEVRPRLGARALCTLCILAVVPNAARAQAIAVAGIVSDSAGVPIGGAEVRLSDALVITGNHGEFRIVVFDRGPTVLRVRRLGFRADSVRLQLGAVSLDSISVSLRRVAAALEPVMVRADRIRYTGRLAGYYERLERRSGGYFITRDQIDRENPRSLSQLLQHVPGVSGFRGRGGLQGVRMRGRNCAPLVWIDGTPMSAGEVDLDAFPPSTIHGIELYLGSTNAPMRYTSARSLSSCGTILLWSRGVDTDPIERRPARAAKLEASPDMTLILMADQVDVQAHPEPGKGLKIDYPSPLYAERISGTVVAEFIVNADGKVETGSIGIISSPHELFSEAVRTAVARGKYLPATLAGRPVRQLVHQPFTFAPPGRALAGDK